MNRIYLKLLFLFIVLLPIQAMSQDHVLRGVVTDVSGPLIGATVYCQNKDERTINGVITNANGEYFLKVPTELNVKNIVFSFIGYKTQVIKYTGQTKLDIKLIEDATLLETATVTARVVEKDAMGMDSKAIGGARQKIDLAEFQDMSVTSVEDMLQGKMANVDIVAASGAPGSKMSIRIRGTASLNASNEPLIVIDNVPFSKTIDENFDFGSATEDDYGALVNISPSDIQSIEVLKDASATAVWGAKAANGVLVITTKRGTKSKPTFQVTQKVSTSIEPKRVPRLNGKEYVSLMQDALWNNVRDNQFGNMELLKQYKDILYDQSYLYFREFNQDVDWLDYLIQTPFNSDTNLNISGGGDKATYRFSVSYYTEKGTTISEDFKRITSRLNLDYRFSSKLMVTAQFSYAEGDRNGVVANPRDIANRKMPNMTPFILDADGNMTDEYFVQPASSIQGDMKDMKLYNPIALVYDGKNNTVNRDMGINFQINYDIMTGLRFTANVAFDQSTSRRKYFLPVSATGLPMSHDDYNRAEKYVSNSNKLYLNGGFNYNKVINENHVLAASFRFQAEDYASDTYEVKTSGSSSVDMGDPSASGRLLELKAGKGESRSVAFVGSLLYTFKNKWNINGLIRSDGSSSTGKNSRWGTFPSVNLVYYMNRENFLKDYTWLADLRPRVSWGKSGNPPTGSSTYAGTYSAINDGYLDLSGTKPNSMQLNKLKWEVTTSFNYGIDLGFVDDKIHAAFDYYVKTTDDLLQEKMRIPGTTGYTQIPWFNDGKLENRGWEFYIRVRDLVNRGGFKLGIDFNLSRNRNKVLELPSNLEYTSPEIKNGSYANKVVKGRPLGAFYGFRYLGVYQNNDETIARDRFGNVIKDVSGKNIHTSINSKVQHPGDAKYYDKNFDGIIDKYDIVYLGNSMPLMIGGGALILNYKGVNLRTSFQFRLGQSVINRARLNAEMMKTADNQSTAVLRRWKAEGDDTDIPRALWGDNNYNSLGSDRYVEKASFLKIKDITLSYRFTRNFCKKIGLRGLYMYLTSYDVFTFTNYKGQDPEVGLPAKFNNLAEDNSLSPRPRRFAFGLTVDF